MQDLVTGADSPRLFAGSEMLSIHCSCLVSQLQRLYLSSFFDALLITLSSKGGRGFFY